MNGIKSIKSIEIVDTIELVSSNVEILSFGIFTKDKLNGMYFIFINDVNVIILDVLVHVDNC